MSSIKQAAREFFSQQGVRPANTQRDRINGMNAVTGVFEAISGQTLIAGRVAFVEMDGKVYRILGYTPESRWRAYDGIFEQVIRSFDNVTDRRYFYPRPSAVEYNASSSGGSNLGPTNPLLIERVNASVSGLRSAGVTGPVPAELVMASGSGLDPHLSVEAALVQAPLVAAARNRSVDEMRALVLAGRVADPTPFHPEYVNVNDLNRALDAP
jgi:K+-transporting ATPase KdpC subunit